MNCYHTALVSDPKLHSAHGRAAAPANSGVKPFIAVAQSFKQILKNYLKTQSAAQSSSEGFPQIYIIHK